MLKEFKDSDFDTLIKNEEVSVIQFSATWCGPCQALKPVMEKISEEYKDRGNFYITDIEDSGMRQVYPPRPTSAPHKVRPTKSIDEVPRENSNISNAYVIEDTTTFTSSSPSFKVAFLG